jgi:hypothetical protein
MTVRNILTNPHYVGDYRYGQRPSGRYGHVMVAQDDKDRKAAAANVQRDAHAGLIDRATWDTVQRKIARRQRTGQTTHARGMFLSGGLLHCGHCGGKMYGSPSFARRKNGVVKEYRYYVCPNYQNNPGACQRYTMREDKLLPFLLRKVTQVYLDPERLEGLRATLKDRAAARHKADPVRAERLRKKMAAVDQDIRQGARNLVRATDNLDLIQEALTALRAERDKLARELETVEREQALPVEDLTTQVDRAVNRLLALKDELHKAKPERVREILRLLVSRIDLYWEEAKPGPTRAWFRFAKGIIKLRPILESVKQEV